MWRGAELKEMIISGGHTSCPLHLLRCQASEDVIDSSQTFIPKIMLPASQLTQGKLNIKPKECSNSPVRRCRWRSGSCRQGGRPGRSRRRQDRPCARWQRSSPGWCRPSHWKHLRKFKVQNSTRAHDVISIPLRILMDHDTNAFRIKWVEKIIIKSYCILHHFAKFWDENTERFLKIWFTIT